MSRKDVNIDELESFEDDRGGFDGGPKKRVAGLRAFILVMLLLALALVGWVVYQQIVLPSLQEQDSDQATKPVASNSLPGAHFSSTPSNAVEPQTYGTSEEAMVPEAEPGTYSPPSGTPPSDEERELTPEEKATLRRLGKSLNASDAITQPVSSTGASSRSEYQRPAQASSASAELATRMNSARYATSKATRMQNMHMTIAAGTMINCGAITELDTTVPGFVSCKVSREVRSADGSVVLIDKNAVMTGEVSAGILQGQARAFVLWSRVRNQDGAVAYLDAPGTNRLGSAGVPGQVDTHFWERLGQAMMVSVFSDLSRGVMQSLINSTQKGSSNTNVNLDDSSNSQEQLASEVLRATINIPPTLTVNHGETVSVFVPRDVDFSDVYDLELVE